jgi:hypothetical protein
MTNFMAPGKATDPCHPDISVCRQSAAFNNVIVGGGDNFWFDSLATSTNAKSRRMNVHLLDNINMQQIWNINFKAN